MAFRLRTDESVAKGLRRLARKELRAAQDALKGNTPPPDEAIHEARKSIKKVRAIVSLVEADDGRRLGDCKKRLRRISHTLSPLRDADAMLETLKKLTQRAPRLLSEHAFVRVRRELSSHKQTLMKAAEDAAVWKDLARDLQKLRRQARHWRPAHRNFGVLAAGIRATYREGRKSARASKSCTAAGFHEWRKQIKALWYELRLIEGPGAGVGRDLAALHRAETWLGDDHNVVVLLARLSKDGSFPEMARLRQVADRYQAGLRRKVSDRMARMYARKPGEYVRRIKLAWQRRQSHRPTKASRKNRAAA